MSTAVRYYSRSGNTRAIAEAIAQAVNVKAISADSVDAAITESVDTLFIGGALYAYGLDGKLTEYLKTIKKENVKKAVMFSSTWISKHSFDLIRRELENNGIKVESDTFYVRGKPSAEQLNEAKKFAEKYL